MGSNTREPPICPASRRGPRAAQHLAQRALKLGPAELPGCSRCSHKGPQCRRFALPWGRTAILGVRDASLHGGLD